MGIETLIERLRTESLYADKASLEIMDLCMEAATALSTLQAENAQLRESRDHWKRLAHELSEGVNGKDAEHERLQAENEKLQAELKSKVDLVFRQAKELDRRHLLLQEQEAELEQVKRENSHLKERLYGMEKD